jgi:hypothetical protein
MKRHYVLILSLIAATVACLVYSYIRSVNDYRRKPIFAMWHNAHLIGIAIIEYRKDNQDRLPSRLSELVPRYVSYSNVDQFFWPPSDQGLIKIALDSGALSNKIDNDGAFYYLGYKGSNENLIFCERTNLWKSITNESGQSVVTLTTNCTPLLRLVEDATSRLSRLSAL